VEVSDLRSATAGALLILLSAGCSAEVARKVEDRKTTNAVIAAMPWLPPDTETLVALQGPIDLLDEAGPAAPGFERFFIDSARSLLPLLPQQPVRELFLGRPVRLALNGSRKFAALGRTIGHEGCQLFIFDRPLADGGQEIAGALEKAAGKYREAAGVKICTFSAEGSSIPVSVALPRPDVLCIALDDAYLREVLERMARPPAGRALPFDLREWEFLRPQARGWAIRHYAKDRAGSDPTSLLGPNALGVMDPGAVGIAFGCRPEDHGDAVLTLVSAAPKPEEVLGKLWEAAKGAKPKTEKIRGGAQSRLPASAAGACLPVIEILLGNGKR
jgi:hypothetical protein